MIICVKNSGIQGFKVQMDGTWWIQRILVSNLRVSVLVSDCLERVGNSDRICELTTSLLSLPSVFLATSFCLSRLYSQIYRHSRLRTATFDSSDDRMYDPFYDKSTMRIEEYFSKMVFRIFSRNWGPDRITKKLELKFYGQFSIQCGFAVTDSIKSRERCIRKNGYGLVSGALIARSEC